MRVLCSCNPTLRKSPCIMILNGKKNDNKYTSLRNARGPAPQKAASLVGEISLEEESNGWWFPNLNQISIYWRKRWDVVTVSNMLPTKILQLYKNGITPLLRWKINHNIQYGSLLGPKLQERWRQQNKILNKNSDSVLHPQNWIYFFL